MDIKFFVKLTSRAWALPILWNMDAGVAGRQAPLLTATGAGRTAFAQSMVHLIAMGLMERNPGHGHPLRPEFRLTKEGMAAASIARQIRDVSAPRDEDLLRRAWTLPVLTFIHRPGYFNEIKRGLPMITDRALSQSLQSMANRKWVCRKTDASVSPRRAAYYAVDTGKRISQITATEIATC